MAETIKRKRNPMKNTLTKTVILRIENLLAKGDNNNNNSEDKEELAVSEITVANILEELNSLTKIFLMR